MENKFNEILEKTLVFENLDEKTGLQKLSDTIATITKIDIESAEKTVKTISDTIDLVDKNYKDIITYKEKGGTAQSWLNERLDELDSKFPDKNVSLDGVKEELKDAAKDSLKMLMGDSNKDIDDIIARLSKTDNIQHHIGLNTLSDLMALSQADDKTLKIEENPIIKKYFEDKLDSERDLNFKKATSTAVYIAGKNKILPQAANKTANEIALIADKSLTEAKVAYKVAIKELNPLDAAEYLVDRSVSIINSAIVTKTTEVGGAIGASIGTFIGSIFGPTGSSIGAKIGGILGKMAGYKVGEFISEGVKKIVNAIKSIASKAWEGAKNVVGSIADFFGF